MDAINRSTQDPNEDVYLVQNPALGAALVWRFVECYAPKGVGRLPTLPLLFIVLPVVFHKELRDVAIRTNPSSGLRVFAGKFSTQQEVLYGVHERMLRLKELSLSSISIALQCGLVDLKNSSAELSSLRQTKPKELESEIKDMLTSAERLGHWCKELTLQEVQAILRIKL